MREKQLLEKIRYGEDINVREKIFLALMLSLPSIMARLTSVAMEYIDASMVGHLGSNESAAIGLVASTTWLFGSVGMASIAGFTIQAAQAIGARKDHHARNLLWQSYIVVIILGIIIGIIGAGISPFLPVWLKGDESILRDASLYFLIYSLSLPFRVIKYLSGSMLQCSGNMRVPGILNSLLCVLDVILNFFFIYETSSYSIWGLNITVPGLGLGVAGAALGTALADTIIGLLMLYFLAVRTPIFHFDKNEKYELVKHDLSNAFKLSLPIAFEQVVVCGAMVLTTVIIAPLGVIAVAANSFAITAESLCYMPCYGISDAASTLVGQSVGAKRPGEVKSFGRICLYLGMAIIAVLTVVMYIAAPFMMRLLSADEEVIRLGVTILRIEAFAEVFYGASIVLTGVFRGAGDTFVPSIMSLISLWAVRIPLYFILTDIWGLKGAWIAMASELIFRGLIFIVRFISKKWMKKAVV